MASEDEHRARYACLAALFPAGHFAVQLREPHYGTRQLLQFARALQASLHPHGAPLIVNDRLDVACTLGTLFVHFGTRSVSVADARRLLGPDAYVSVACHSLDDVARAADAGATAALLSPIFPTPGKGPAHGTAILRAATQLPRPLPVVALGGVNASNAVRCLDAGAMGIAAIRAWFSPKTAAWRETVARSAS